MRLPSITASAAIVFGALLTGCCGFVPCHPGTWVTGSVLTADGQALPGARVTLYGTTKTTNAVGCFNSHVSNALPFTFAASAAGYKTAETRAMPGFHRVQVKLVASESLASSQVEWFPISEADYLASKPCQ